MEKVTEWVQDPKNRPILIFAAGILIGWFVLGWMLLPAPARNAKLSQLRDKDKETYLCNVVHGYLRTGDKEAALAQVKALGRSGMNDLGRLTPGTCYLNAEELTMFRVAISTVEEQPKANETAPAEQEPKPTTAPQTGQTDADKKSSGLILPILLCLSTILLGAAIVYFFFLKGGTNPKSIDVDGAKDKVSGWIKNGKEKATAVVGGLRQQRENSAEQNLDPVPVKPIVSDKTDGPIAQYLAKYEFGDEQFSEANSIDDGTGEFLGECGMDIADWSEAEDGSRVNAFEVWLFDRNDIQTATKVLMTPYAFSDPVIRGRLESKGEMLHAQADQVVELESATLRMEARVRELKLRGDSLPEETFFEKLTVELWVYEKDESAG